MAGSATIGVVCVTGPSGGDDVRRRVVMGANGLKRVHDLGIAHSCIGARDQQDVVQRYDAQYRATESFYGQPPNAMLLHCRERCVHVVFGSARVNGCPHHFANRDL